MSCYWKKVLKPKYNEFIRFVIVGILATMLHYAIYLLLLKLTTVNAAYAIGYAVSFCVNFLMTNVFTFKTKPTAKKGIGFALSHLINYGLHLILLNLFIYLGIAEKIAPVFIYAIAVPANFLLVRIVFKSKWSV